MEPQTISLPADRWAALDEHARAEAVIRWNEEETGRRVTPMSQRPPQPASEPCKNDGCFGRCAQGHWVEYRTQEGGRWAPGAYACPACIARDDGQASASRHKTRLDRSGMPSRLHHLDIDQTRRPNPGETEQEFYRSLTCVGVVQSNKSAVDSLQSWHPHSGSVFLSGPTGTGKTTLAAALASKLCADGWGVAWADEETLLADERAAIDASYKGLRPVYKARQAQVLVIDDAGRSKPSEWTRGLLSGLVEYRESRRLSMIITSNLSRDELGNLWGERVGSRLAGMCRDYTLRLTGGDWRRK